MVAIVAMRSTSLAFVLVPSLLLACGDDTTSTTGGGGAGGETQSSAGGETQSDGGGGGGTTSDGGGGSDNPCFPDICTGPSSSGTGDGGGAGSCPEEVACGGDGATCDPTTEFCESFAGGPAGSGTSYSCIPFGDCAPDDCECLKEATTAFSTCEAPGDDCLVRVSSAGE